VGVNRLGRSLTFRSAESAAPIEAYVSSLIVAGFTGRDRRAVQSHIDELAAAGIAAPARFPEFYEVPTERLTTSQRVAVEGPHTSGEAEVVLVRSRRGWVIAVGSDHTDRDVERDDIAASKRICPKIIGVDVLPLDVVEAAWDVGRLRSWVDDEPYQDGALADLRSPRDLLDELRSTAGISDERIAMYCGTVPLLHGEFRFGRGVRLELDLDGGHVISCSYDVVT
jgi:4-hydroxyphenylacetate 3-monooxygenase